MGFNSGFKGLILIACPLQQWLHERASILRYTYIVFVSYDYHSKQLLFYWKTLTDWYLQLRHGVLSQKYQYNIRELDVYESVHRDTIMKVTNKMQLYRLIYYS